MLLWLGMVYGSFYDAIARMTDSPVLCREGEVQRVNGFSRYGEDRSITYVMYIACLLPNSTIMTRIGYFPSLYKIKFVQEYEMYQFTLNEETSVPWRPHIRLFTSCPHYRSDYYANSCDFIDLNSYSMVYGMKPVISKIEIQFEEGMIQYAPKDFFELLEESKEERQIREERMWQEERQNREERKWQEERQNREERKWRENDEQRERERQRIYQTIQCVRDHVYPVPPKYKVFIPGADAFFHFLTQGYVFHDPTDVPPYAPFFRQEEVIHCNAYEVEVQVTFGQFLWLLWIAFGKVVIGIMIGVTMIWLYWIYEKKTCCICLDSIGFSSNLTTSCRHTYHTVCLQEWLKQQLTCPLCRTKIPKK